MNENKQLQFLDYLNIASFWIGLMNLDQNMTQNDKQELQQQLNTSVEKLLNELHTHLERQDNKINEILAKLEADKNDN